MLKRTKFILELVIAVIPDLVAVDDTANVAGIDLHTSLQTKHCIAMAYSHKLVSES